MLTQLQEQSYVRDYFSRGRAKSFLFIPWAWIIEKKFQNQTHLINIILQILHCQLRTEPLAMFSSALTLLCLPLSCLLPPHSVHRLWARGLSTNNAQLLDQEGFGSLAKADTLDLNLHRTRRLFLLQTSRLFKQPFTWDYNCKLYQSSARNRQRKILFFF